MKRFFVFLAVVIAVGLAAYWAAGHHIVRTDQGVIVLNKRFLGYTDTCVDLRTWKAADFDAHPALKRALIDQGYRDVLVEIRTRELTAVFNGALVTAAVLADEILAEIERAIEVWLGEAPGATNPPAPDGYAP